MHFTPSLLNVLGDCDLCFWLMMRPAYKDRVPRPRGPFPTLPSGIDRRIKERYDEARAKGILPPELSSLRGAKLYNNLTLLREWQNNRKGLRIDQPDGTSIKGALDDLLVNAQGYRIPVDGKTRGFPPKEHHDDYYKNQLGVYNLLLDAMGHETTGRGILVYYWPISVVGRYIAETVGQHAHYLKSGELLNLCVKSIDDGTHKDLEQLPEDIPAVGYVFAYEMHEVEVSLDETNALIERAKSVATKKHAPSPSDDCEYCQYASSRTILIANHQPDEASDDQE